MSNWLSFLGWSFLPDWIVNNLQSFYYSLTIRAGSPHPQPGTPLFQKHRRRIYILVILLYLCYQLYEADWNIQREGDFYTDLGVSYDADDRTIQSRFRKLTLQYHPDKLPPDTPTALREAASARYISLTLARDVLVSPTKRWAYDRLGPIITTSPAYAKATKPHDFVLPALRGLIPVYISGLLGIYLLTFLNLFRSEGILFRNLSLLTLLILELHTLTRPDHTKMTLIPTILNPWIRALTSSIPPLITQTILRLPQDWASRYLHSPYLPFQAIGFCQKAAVTLFIAVGRLGPLVFNTSNNNTSSTTSSEGGDQQLLAQIGRLENLVGVNALESARQLALETVPFKRAGLFSIGDGRNGQGRRREGGQGEGVDESVRQDQESEQQQRQDQRTQGSTGASSGPDPGLQLLAGKIKDWFVTNTIRQDPEVRRAVERTIEARQPQPADE